MKTIMICTRCRAIMAYIDTTDGKPRRGLCTSCLSDAIISYRQTVMAMRKAPTLDQAGVSHSELTHAR